jgi:pimeloyl-ACP methyl ester carboxylesterase
VTDALPKDGRAVLVGHSMAGMVISQTAERVPQQVSQLIYVAAYLPRNGESLYKLAQTDADSRVPRYWQQANPAAYSPATIKTEGLAEVFCADCTPADQAALAARHRAEAVPPLGTPVTLSAAAWGRVPKLYVHTLRDQAVSYTLQRTMVANAGPGVQTAALDSAHAPMLSQPQALAELIAKAAQAAQ